ACQIVRDRLGDGPVYITFDLDSLDPTIAPAVSNLEPGACGFSIDAANQLLHCTRGKTIIGGDVVCLMPTKDQSNNITSMVASTILFEIMSLVADGFAG
ncbi:MAG: arginase family protein, partial [Hyphomicrobiaceae bacterium]